MKKITIILAVLFTSIIYAQAVDEKICDGSVTHTVKENGDIRYIAITDDNISFIAGNINGGDEISYYVSLKYVGGDKPMVKKKGVKINLQNGEIISKPDVEIKVDVNKKAEFEYTAFLPLTVEEAKMLVGNKMVSTELYVMMYKLKDPETIQRVFTCIYENTKK